MLTTRTIRKVSSSRPTLEGAGVRLRRAFGFGLENELDPFLLLDDFRSQTPSDFIKGFPWHPHRGIETITYVLEGQVEHSDSLGHRGLIGAGDVQWMTAGNGIIHQEMPLGDEQGRMGGFQLWANLPAAKKMMNPRYRDINHEQIPLVTRPGGIQIRVICGEVDGVCGPVQDVIIDPQYLDISIPPDERLTFATQPGHTVFAYVISGAGVFAPQSESTQTNGCLVQFNDGEQVIIHCVQEPLRFLLISGKPINEPVAWYGPIVMNTQEELQTAFDEYRKGTFLKHRDSKND